MSKSHFVYKIVNTQGTCAKYSLRINQFQMTATYDRMSSSLIKGFRDFSVQKIYFGEITTSKYHNLYSCFIF